MILNLRCFLHASIFVLLFCLSACSSSINVIPIDVPTRALEKAVENVYEEGAKKTLIADGSIPANWWQIFEDDQLESFILKTFKRNPTLQLAQARIMMAAYAAESARSALYPYLSLGADVSRQKLSETGVIPFKTASSAAPVVSAPVTPGPSSGIPEYFTLYETELNLTYHFDFWNKNRNTLRAALGLMQANMAEEQDTRLQLGIMVAEVYYHLQTNYQRQKILKAFIDNRQRYVDLIQTRIKGSIENELSLQTAEYNLTDAKDVLLQIQGNIAQEEYQLKAYMADTFEEEITPVYLAELPKIPVPADLPMRLLAQRADIVAQLWVIESAGRQIEVAKAGFYPDFNLTAFAGFQTIHFRELFRGNSAFFNVDPAMVLPIFDAGRLLANLRSKEVDYEIAILDYNNLVLNAAREALEGIALLRNAWLRFKEAEAKVARQKELHRLIQLRVANNLNSPLDELVSEGNVLMSQDQEIQALGLTIQAALRLIKSLGGGFKPCGCIS